MATFGRFLLGSAGAELGPTKESEHLLKFESPSPKAVLGVKDFLLKISKLPLEIIDIVIDYAEYWPCTTVTTAGENTAFSSFGNPNQENKFILRSFPLGYLPTNGNDLPIIPSENYPIQENIAHDIESSEDVQATTLSILTQWKDHSLPRGDHPCRKVVFTIRSMDQGWGGERSEFRGTYKGSYTWFDVGLEHLEVINTDTCMSETQTPNGFIKQLRLESGDGTLKGPTSIYCDFCSIWPPVIKDPSNPSHYKFDHPFLPSQARLQSNRTATPELKEYIITWAYDDCVSPRSPGGDRLEEEGRGRETGNGNFVRNLKIGDIITIWARARFSGWRNNVVYAKIDLYWAV